MRRFELVDNPYPHLIVKDIIDPAIYATLKFPDISKRPGAGRIGRDLYPGEPEWTEVISQGPWAEVYRELTGSEFVLEVLSKFSNAIEARGCKIDLQKVYLEDFIESREDMGRAPLSTDYDPNSLFVRFDLQASDGTHGLRTPHVDHLRRIVGGVIFLSDSHEEGITGGEFALWLDENYRNDRRCHKPKFAKSYPIQHNTAYFFLNCNNAFHGPLAITRIDGMRKWIYFSISSRRDVWEFDPSLRERVSGVVKRLIR